MVALVIKPRNGETYRVTIPLEHVQGFMQNLNFAVQTAIVRALADMSEGEVPS